MNPESLSFSSQMYSSNESGLSIRCVTLTPGINARVESDTISPNVAFVFWARLVPQRTTASHCRRKDSSHKLFLKEDRPHPTTAWQGLAIKNLE
jgi:hypothetical protein